MQSFNFDRNVRFSYMLPYGFVSPQAFILSLPANESSFIVYDPNKPMDLRIYESSLNYQTRMRKIKAMAELGYIQLSKCKCGKKDWEQITQYSLTKAGLFFLTNTPNEQVEKTRLESIPRLQNRNKKKLNYSPDDPQFYANQYQLYELAKNPNPNATDLQAFERLFLDSVEYDNISLLATEPVLAESVQITSTRRTEAHYRAWKLMNVEALFKANDYLTEIDRKHYEPPLTSKQKENEQIDIYTFCKQTLSRWYETHPQSFLYLTPQESLAEEIKNKWKNTPIFYPISDIDDTLIEVDFDSEINEKKTTKSYRHLCLGVAVGKEKNYIVHHTRTGGTPWTEMIERNTVGSVQQRLNKINEETPVLGANRTICNALMICPTIAQFSALFTMAKQTTSRGRKRTYRIGTPYDSVCIVPICPSGAMQLRGLMESSPIDYTKAIRTFLLQHNGFAARPPGGDERDNIFSLSFNQIPVLIAHTMDWQTLSWAKELYEENYKFYVSCYPEQVKYIRTIMPDVEFL